MPDGPVVVDAMSFVCDEPRCDVGRADPGVVDEESHGAMEAASAVCPAADLIEVDRMVFGLDHQHASVSAARIACLVYRTSAYELGRFAAGQSVRVGPTSKRSELKTLLTGQRTVRGEGDKWQTSDALRPIEHGPRLHPADDDVL